MELDQNNRATSAFDRNHGRGNNFRVRGYETEAIMLAATLDIDGQSSAQIKRQTGKRVQLAKPKAEDINVLLNALAITDPDTRKSLPAEE